MSSPCHGNGPEHCCYLPGSGVADPAGTNQSVCPFLAVDAAPGRKWSCGLYLELGDWSLVHQDQRYLDVVRPVWQANDPPVTDCGDWGFDPVRDGVQCCFAEDTP